MKGVVHIVDKKSGTPNTAVYAANRLGNMQWNVDGKFYNDTKFDKRFKIVHNESNSIIK